MASKIGSRRWMLQLIMQLGSVLLTRCPFWGCFSQLMLYAERAEARRKPDIPVPYLYFDMGAAVLCASFMSFGVKRRWFALGAALQLAISTYAAYIGGYVHYGDWLKVRMYSRTVAIIGGFLVLASGAGELYRRKPRSRSLQSTGQVFLGIYLICVNCWGLHRVTSYSPPWCWGQCERGHGQALDHSSWLPGTKSHCRVPMSFHGIC
ncbi:transmembrane protein 101 isoform X2 [Tupaia chinensis]|uniref:transmembrane protein 101 isoform X2 n=1 Tax=Tupaia chinensis TaxID=246437 RepID=UPI0003C8C67C|nr:transmembrane protein 101 isoform X2 [Tupaia chinensis]